MFLHKKAERVAKKFYIAKEPTMTVTESVEEEATEAPKRNKKTVNTKTTKVEEPEVVNEIIIDKNSD